MSENPKRSTLNIADQVTVCLRTAPKGCYTTNELAVLMGLPPSVTSRTLHRMLLDGAVRLQPELLFSPTQWTLPSRLDGQS